MGFDADDHRYMALALQLAKKGLYSTDPNPRVGCVIVRDGLIVGQGWHERAGEPHAEVHALRDAGERARGATAYVSLEPCCHQGKTPPCSQALIDAGVARVIAAMVDPHSRVAGQGLARLREAGIEVQSGLLESQARALNPGFIKRMETGLPWLRNKLAMSVDGRTAMASGESQWITGPAARQDVQRLRARSSAILTGVGTVLADDPAMTVRLDGIGRQPLRVIVDSRLRTPPAAKILQQDGETLIMTCHDDATASKRLQQAGATVVTLPAGRHGVDLEAVLRELAQREVNEVLLESGAVLSGSMLQAGFVDELVIYMAPVLMGDSARGLFHLPGLQHMKDKVRLHIDDIRAVGEDWRLSATIDRTEQ